MIRVLIQLFVLVLLWSLFGAMSYWLHPHAKKLFEGGQIAVPQAEGEISLEEAKRMAADGRVLWIDVRPLAEFTKEHIPGAENVPSDTIGALETKLFEWTQSERLRPETMLVIYCASTSCGTSHQLRKQLLGMNSALKVLVLAGGWTEWKRGEALP